jgi:protein-S-isoprenylcysteine O-methyltransferase Ste14
MFPLAWKPNGPFVPFTFWRETDIITANMNSSNQSTDSSPDNPGVIARPPLLYVAALAIILVLRWIRPLPIPGHVIVLWTGIAFLVFAMAILIAGRYALSSAGTNVNPALPTTTIVMSGPFRFSRNPLYVGLNLFLFGLTLTFDTWWGLIILVPLGIIMHRGVVLREERYLEQKFGDTYREYRSRVRRYL